MKPIRIRANMPTSLAMVLLAVAAVLTVCESASAAILVPGYSNIYGAGHSGPAATPAPVGASPGGGNAGGLAPPSFAVFGGEILSFSVVGMTAFTSGGPTHGSDGVPTGFDYNFGSYNGIAGFRADRSFSLFGVFTGLTEPADPAPAQMDFRSSTSFLTLAAPLNSIFYIGDGLTGNGTGLGLVQEFTVPAGATSLYLGFADGDYVSGLGVYMPGMYNDNSGELAVTITPIPEPGTFLMTAVGALLACGLSRSRRTRITTSLAAA